MGKASKGTKASTAESSSALKPALSINVRHILCEKQGKALEALTKIQAGDSFATVAATYSEDKARSGGSLGWKTKAELTPAFADAAFALAVGQYTKQPVKSPFGYHIILVEGRK
jgi:peptidyl-prolyl cis-trans isomerase NIMA-interacting 4